MSRSWCIALAASIAALLLPAGVAAAAEPGSTRYGATEAGHPVVLTFDARGLPLEIRYRWVASCARGGDVRPPRAWRLRLAPKDVSADRFTAASTTSTRQKGGLRIRSRVVARGARDLVGGERWAGTWTVDVTVRRRGRLLTRCRLPVTPWQASGGTGAREKLKGEFRSRPAWTWAWQLTQTAPVAGSWAMGAPGARATATGSPKHIVVVMRSEQLRPGMSFAAGWHFGFGAPAGQVMRPGRYAVGGPGGASAELAGPQLYTSETECLKPTGTVDVQAVSVDADGGPRVFQASFELACGETDTVSGAGAGNAARSYRGTIAFTAA